MILGNFAGVAQAFGPEKLNEQKKDRSLATIVATKEDKIVATRLVQNHL